MYLKIQGIQNLCKGPRYPKGTYRSKVSKRYLKVQGIQKVPKVKGVNKVPKIPKLPKVTYKIKVSK